ncbi:glycosyltransferase [Bacteroides sp.]|uniref:glycosyltransferase n=1 Tax=Bacteroides sp. TaxID=29523 RepID=UPI0025BBEB6F|nr:glycosyltransferase [Bacteroides sp.]
MNIVFSSHIENSQGGAQRCLLDLIKGIKDKYPQCNIYVIFPAEGDFIELLEPYISGYTIIKQPWWLVTSTPKKRIELFLRILKYSRKTLAYLKRIHPDIVVTNTITSPVVAIASKLGGYKHLWFIHEMPIHTGFYTFVLKEKIIMHLVDKTAYRILVVSDSAKNYYRRFITRKNRIQKIEVTVGINLNQFRKEKNPYLTMLFVGNFDTNKNQEEAINACKLLKERDIDFYLYLVGATEGNPYVEFIRKKIENSQLENMVSVEGFTNDIMIYYNKTDILLLCSATEAKPRVIIEAQKIGIPVIATDIDAHRELIKDGYNGILYKRGNVEEMADSIQRLNDDKLRIEMSENALATMKGRYEINQFVDEFMKVGNLI